MLSEMIIDNDISASTPFVKDTIASLEQRFSQQHLCHDAACRPDINCNREQTSACHINLLFLFCFTRFPVDKREFTCLRVVHPVQYDLRSSVPARHHVAGHLRVRLPRQAEVQNLNQTEKTAWTRKRVNVQKIHVKIFWVGLPLTHSPG